MRFILDSFRSVTEDKISKYQACQFLGISRAKFDNMVMEGKIPKGRKQSGFKELFWYKSELKNITMNK